MSERARLGLAWLSAAVLSAGLAAAVEPFLAPDTGAAASPQRPVVTAVVEAEIPVGPATAESEVAAASDRTAGPGTSADSGAGPSHSAGVAVPPAEHVVPAPARVVIPAIGLVTDVVPTGVDAAGALAVPTDPSVAGWYTGGPAPGEPGPAVLAGHVDSRRGPGVFSRLSALQVGDEVSVSRHDGSALRFLVARVEQHRKDDFPSGSVYAPAPAPELRLITCGGTFDRSARRYRDNVVVFARLAA